MAIDTLRIKEPNVDADGEALASGGETPASTRGAGLHQQVQHLADGPLSPDGLGQGQVPLDLVGVPTTVPVLYDVARLGQLGDDGLGAAFGDVERSGDVAQTHPGVAGDAEKGTGVLVKKLQFVTPLLPHFWNGIASVRCGVRLVATVGASAESVVPCLNIFSSRVP